MRSNARDTDDPKSVVDRISAILESFKGAGPLTLAEVTFRTGLPRSTVHRLLEQLVITQLIAREDHRYELGTRSYEIGQWAIHQNLLRSCALPVLNQLARTSGLTVHLAVLDRTDAFYLERIPGRKILALPTRVGSRIPTHLTAVGKVMLANLDPERMRLATSTPLRQSTQFSIATHDQLDKELERVRNHGAAMDREEFALGIACVAASIGPRDNQYGNRAAVAVCGPVDAIKLNQLTPRVRMAARDIWEACTANNIRRRRAYEATFATQHGR